ncbi:MAG: hypothetical protein M3083_19800 [Actinomycetota bacterium]|nr:hypothetical protein [Actinomycetota bacterium]
MIRDYLASLPPDRFPHTAADVASLIAARRAARGPLRVRSGRHLAGLASYAAEAEAEAEGENDGRDTHRRAGPYGRNQLWRGEFPCIEVGNADAP